MGACMPQAYVYDVRHAGDILRITSLVIDGQCTMHHLAANKSVTAQTVGWSVVMAIVASLKKQFESSAINTCSHAKLWSCT